MIPNLKVTGTNKIHDFMLRHTDSKDWLKAWLAEAKVAVWQGPNDIKERYSSASFLEDNTVIFNVKGNKYRMEIRVSFNTQVVYIRRVGTHAEYDRWDK